MKSKFEQLIDDTRERLKGKPLETAALNHFVKTDAVGLVANTACFRCNRHATIGLAFQRAKDPKDSTWRPSVLACGKMATFMVWPDGQGMREGMNVPVEPFFCSSALEPLETVKENDEVQS